jgi:hypothetical protein
VPLACAYWTRLVTAFSATCLSPSLAHVILDAEDLNPQDTPKIYLQTSSWDLYLGTVPNLVPKKKIQLRSDWLDCRVFLTQDDRVPKLTVFTEFHGLRPISLDPYLFHQLSPPPTSRGVSNPPTDSILLL